MTLLSICQGAARAARISVPASIIGNNSDEALLLLQMANDEGEALARRKVGGWSAMVTEYDFQTSAFQASCTLNGTNIITGIPSTALLAANTWQVLGNGFPNNNYVVSVDSGTQIHTTYPTTQSGVNTITFGLADYALPSDYQRTVDGTFWDRSRFWQMRGALSPQQWQGFKSSILGYSATVQRRYRIRNVAGTVYLSIDPTPTDNAANLVFEYVSNGWCQSTLGARQTQWLADTDTGVIDEFLMRKGVVWRSLERLGMASDTARAEYENLCDMAVAADAGTQVIDMAPSGGLVLVGPWSVPDTGYGA